MRRISRMLAITASVGIFAAACSSGDGGGDATDDNGGGDSTETEAPVRGDEDLVVWTTEDKLNNVRAVADLYEAQEGITVGVATLPDPREAFVTANAAGNGPDVLVGAHDWLGQLNANGAVDPIQLTPSVIDSFAPIAIEAATYDGQIYGVPYGVEAIVLYCNADISPDTYSTLEDVIAAGEAAGAELPLALEQGQNGDAYHMEPLYTSAGGYLFGVTDQGYDATDVGVGKPGSITAGEKIAELADQGILSTSIDNAFAKDKFLTGNAGCWISGPWNLKDVKDSGINYTLQPIPGFAGMEPAQPFMGAQLYMVASNGQNKAFAQSFVGQFVPTIEAQRASFEENRLVPALTELQSEVGAGDPDFEVLATAVDGAAPMPAIPAMAAVWGPLGTAYASIIDGSTQPEQAMTDAGSAIVGAIG